ncbi:hypothetical protein V492_06526 [Pseudogymnoascus sp. VKM F-4246]|nr:hypothetical protein V492_06526 [Pseudogymnoascus sp. VKM F-4246]
MDIGTERYQILSAGERPDLHQACQKPGHPLAGIWPEWIKHTASTDKYWKLMTTIPDIAQLQFMVVVPDPTDNTGLKVIARARSIPFHRHNSHIPESCKAIFGPLPDGGLDDVLRLGMEYYLNLDVGKSSSKLEPNTLSALGITVDPAWRNKGTASLLIHTLKQAAAKMGLRHLVVPARPTLKYRYLDVDMTEYVLWGQSGAVHTSFENITLSGDRPFDPWLRLHVSLGARMVKIAPSSMTVEADTSTWTRWLGTDIFKERAAEAEADKAGQETVTIVIPGGLAKLSYFPSAGIARYVEPNVWMEYDLTDIGK